MQSRRQFLWTAAAAPWHSDLQREFRRLEKRSGGRLGCAVLDTESGAQAGYRENERFSMCSTFKFLAAAHVLKRVDQNEEQLSRRVIIQASDILPNSPTTEKHVGQLGLAISDLCEAAVTRSDNAAANLILASFGGPEGLTRFLRSIGDSSTRLDRTELDLNEARPGDPRDTTTPLAMVTNLQALLLDSILSGSSTALLTQWLVNNTTGAKRIRAGVPAGWRVGDKTGTGRNNTTNDIGIVWPPGRKPILIAIYLTGAKRSGEEREAILKDVARAITA